MAYLVPGTWETNPSANPLSPKGMLANVGNRLAKDYGSQITVMYTPYAASAFDKGKTYAESEQDGVARTSALMARCPQSRIILGGYSQGADVAGDLAEAIGNGNGPVPAASIAGVGLLADPKGQKSAVDPGTGSGISGGRSRGYGALADRMKWICDPTDLYCNVTSKNPLLKSLGETLGATGPNSGDNPKLTSLTSDYENVDLPGAASTADRLGETARSVSQPNSMSQAGQLGQIATLANQLLATFAPIADTQQFVTSTPGAAQWLRSAPAGSPRAQANSALAALKGVDVAGIVRSASAITSSLSKSLGTPAGPAIETTTTASNAASASPDDNSTAPNTALSSTPPSVDAAAATTDPAPAVSSSSPVPTPPQTAATPPEDDSAEAEGSSAGSSIPVPTPTVSSPSSPDPNSSTAGVGDAASDPITGSSGSTPDLTGVASSALSLAAQVAPLKSADKAALQTASSALSLVKLDTIVSQGLNVVSAVFGTDYNGIVANLGKLPQELFRGDIRGAHHTAGELNNQFSPWVKMAAQIDFKTASQLVGMLVPMIPSPGGETQIAGSVAALVLDLLGNLDIVRLARDVGQIQEVAWQVAETGNPLAAAQLLPIGLDLASVAVGVLQPGAKMSPELLGSGATPEQTQLATSLQGQDMGAVMSSVSTLASSQGAADLSKLVGEGLDAATFLASGSHSSYASKKIFAGQTGVDVIYEFFRQALGF